MKTIRNKTSRIYAGALQAFLEGPSPGNLEVARAFGHKAVSDKLLTTDLARFHEDALVTRLLPGFPAGRRPAIIRRAAVFFAAAITPIERTQRPTRTATEQLRRFVEILSRRTVELASVNLDLNLEIAQRRVAERALKRSRGHYSTLLAESNKVHRQMRGLSRKLISAHEDERKKISRELHDVIAQTLTGINLRLATLKKDAATNTKGLAGNITRTQLLVEKSVELVHQFARELRPVVLDDLGLVPALHGYLKQFSERTGVRSKLITFPELEQLDMARKTVLFRVAQEALINISRHARASSVEICISRDPNAVRMEVQDDGQGFDVMRVMRSNRGRRLGLVGMRERLEMAEGELVVESTPGKGTRLVATIPLKRVSSRRRQPTVENTAI